METKTKSMEITEIKNPQISIIVPVYNAEKYLHHCIDSILAQTFIDFELLLIDDGSKDLSGSICDKYARKDSRIRVFHKENGGVSSARNLGLDNAKGEWITFIDADDIVNQSYLTHLFMDVCEVVDFVVAGFEYLASGNKVTYTTKFGNDIKESLSKDYGLTRMYENSFWQWFICSKLFRRNIITRNLIKFDESFIYGEDRLFIMKYVCSINGKMCFSNHPIYKYRIHNDSAMGISKNNFDDNFIKGFDVAIQMYHEILKIKTRKYNRYLALCDIVYSYRTMLRLTTNFQHKNKIRKQITKKMRKVIPLYKYIIICLSIKFVSFFRKIRTLSDEKS